MPSSRRLPSLPRRSPPAFAMPYCPAEVADFEHFFDRVYAQEHQQVEDDREFYRTYNAGFEEE